MFYVRAATSRTSATPSIARRTASLYAEELFGMEGFTGRSSLLYHLVPPTQTHQIEPVARRPASRPPTMASTAIGWSRPATSRPGGNVVDGRVPLFFNSDVVMGVVRPTEALPDGLFYRNGEADEMLFVHEGTRHASRAIFGPMRYGPGDYIVIPIGTTWRLEQDEGVGAPHPLYSSRRPRSCRPSATATTTASCSSTRRICQRDIRVPEEAAPRDESRRLRDLGSSVRGRITAYHYRHHPFDVVGWDGYLYPYIFNIGDFEPITGRVHQPPPVHQTFAGRNYVVCSFVPRKFDYHPLAIPAPYNHSNINSDEVIYYVAGNFMSRRGVEISSFTVHPAGIPHGPHPGTVEASIGKEATEELAVMVDTFHPLNITRQAAELDDGAYPYSWLPPDDASAEARELAERGPEAFPD